MGIIKPYNEDLETLLKDVHQKNIVLPEFQRDFVWEVDAIDKLLQSVARAYPCGSFLFLQNAENGLAYRPIPDSKKPTKEPEKLILDGQQRLSSLYQVFYDKYEYKWYLDLEYLKDRGIEEAFHWYDSEDVAEELPNRESEFKRWEMPLSCIFSKEYDYNDWKEDFLKYQKKNYPDEYKSTEKWIKNVRHEYLKNIDRFEFPILELKSNTKEEVVCQIFEIINSTGTLLNVFELITAKLWPKKIKLRTRWEEAKKKYPYLKEFDDPVTFLKGFSMLSHNERTAGRNEYIYKLTPKHFHDNWDGYTKAFSDTLVILKEELGVVKDKWVPYRLMIPVMAALMTDIENNYKGLNAGKKKNQLKKWFWCTTFYTRIKRYTEARAGGDYMDVLNWFETGAKPDAIENFEFDEGGLELSKPSQPDYKGVLCLMVKNSALDFYTGDKISSQIKMDSTIDDHHIFPRGYFKKMNVDQPLVNSIFNRTMIDGETNKSIGSDKPSSYLKKIERILGEKKLLEVLKSHYIAEDKNSPIFKDHFDGFLEERKNKIFAMIKAVCS